MATPKTPRPTPGVGDTNTPQEVAQVNQAAAQGEQAIQNQAAPAAEAAPESSPQAAPVAGAEQPQEQPVEYQNPGDAGHGPDIPGNERDQALFGPDEDQAQGRPNDGARFGVSAAPEVQSIYEASQDPSAPPAFRQMVQLLQHFHGPDNGANNGSQ